MNLTVKELIELLSNVENQDLEVALDFGDCTGYVESISVEDHHVELIIGQI